jgi:hypothetical protein
MQEICVLGCHALRFSKFLWGGREEVEGQACPVIAFPTTCIWDCKRKSMAKAQRMFRVPREQRGEVAGIAAKWRTYAMAAKRSCFRRKNFFEKSSANYPFARGDCSHVGSTALSQPGTSSKLEVLATCRAVCQRSTRAHPFSALFLFHATV